MTRKQLKELERVSAASEALYERLQRLGDFDSHAQTVRQLADAQRVILRYLVVSAREAK